MQTCGLPYSWEGVEFRDLVAVTLSLSLSVYGLPVFLEEAKSESDLGKAMK